MSHDPMNVNAVRSAIDDCLSGVSALPTLRHDILQRARGETKVKKKLSLALIVAVVLIMAAVTALAVVTIREVARHIAQTQMEEGYFADWPVQQKIRLVRSLSDLGYIEETQAVKRLTSGGMPEAQAGDTADDIVSAYTGKGPEEINFLTIMQVPMGPVDTWTHEEKAWYSQLMAEVGEVTDGRTFYVEPSGAIDEVAAIAIARREVAEGYQVPESALDAYRLQVDFEIPEANEPGDKQAWWHVRFEAPGGMAEDERLFITFPLYIHPETGALMRTVEEMKAPLLHQRPANSLYQAIDAFFEAPNWSFRTWPIELKARYSQEIRPRVQEILKSGDLGDLMNAGQPDIQLIAQSSFIYGLPGEEDISQAEAFALAKAALAERFGIDPAVFEMYSEEIAFFDVTDQQRPLWKFLFNAGALQWESLEGGLDNPLNDFCYKAELDARTGKVVKLEEFLFKYPGRDLAYDLKWY